jgi:hypothetical protein
MLCDKPFQQPDGNGLIHLFSQTGLFAGMVADESADRRQGVDLADQFESLFKLPFGNEGHIAPCVLMNRAGHLTGGKRNASLRGNFTDLSLIKGSPETLFFLPIFRDQFGRTSPDTDIATMTFRGLDERAMGSSFNH